MVQQLPQTNPGFNNTPFKFTKYSNAYMLVYIRESDKDKIICNVDEKDIAEHLRVRSRFNCKVVGYFMILSRHLIHSILILWSNSNEPLTEADCMYGLRSNSPVVTENFCLNMEQEIKWDTNKISFYLFVSHSHMIRFQIVI